MSKETVVDLEKIRMQRLAKNLHELIKERNAKIEANPWPRIIELQNEIYYLLEILMHINMLVNPVEIHLESKFPIQLASLENDRAIEMIEEIRNVLKEM